MKILSTRLLTLCLFQFIFLFPISGFSQSPAGVPSPAFWFKNTLTPNGSNQGVNIIGNHQIDSTVYFFDALKDYKTESSSGTWFWVVNPNFTSSNGVEFARFGDVVINDYGIHVCESFYSHNYSKNRPILLEAHYGGSNAHKVHQELLTYRGDSSLFAVAEALYFDRVLTEFDRRRVESYLGLKYSLNVTIKATGTWKDYLAAEGDSVWDSNSDTYYNQEVLGLGHDTISNWYQVQTATNDSDKIIIAVDSITYLGHEARSAVSPGSKVVFSLRSKRNWGDQTPCELNTGSPVIWEGWKFRVNHWGSVNSRFEVLVDGDLVTTGVQHPMVVLTSDASYVDFLPVSQAAGSYRFSIPLDSIENEANYYIAMVDSGVVCNSQVVFHTTDEISCGNTNAGSISAIISKNLLPAQLIVSDQKGFKQTQNISSESFKVSSLSKGRYDVHLENDEGLLALGHFELGKSCPCSSESNWTVTQGTMEQSIRTSNSIRAYPNPAYAGTSVRFEVTSVETPTRYSIYSGDGRLIEEQATTEKQWNYSFPVSGTYTVQCELENSSLSTQIIIQ